MTNLIGDRGESIFQTRITQDNLFKVYFLGEKAPNVDFLLQVVGTAEPYYFMVQVKSTTQGRDGQGKLKAGVSKAKLKALIASELPTYVAGVDINKEEVFLCPAFSNAVQYKKIPTNNTLTAANKTQSKNVLEKLREDVINYWGKSGVQLHKSTFVSVL